MAKPDSKLGSWVKATGETLTAATWSDVVKTLAYLFNPGHTDQDYSDYKGIDTEHIRDGAISNAKIQASAVQGSGGTGTATIQRGTIDTADLKDDAVDIDKIEDGMDLSSISIDCRYSQKVKDSTGANQYHAGEIGCIGVASKEVTFASPGDQGDHQDEWTWVTSAVYRKRVPFEPSDFGLTAFPDPDDYGVIVEFDSVFRSGSKLPTGICVHSKATNLFKVSLVVYTEADSTTFYDPAAGTYSESATITCSIVAKR